MVRRAWWIVSAVMFLLGSSLASAKEGEIVLTGKRVPMSEVTGVTGKEVILFGPFEPTPALRKLSEVHLYTPITYGGKICTVMPYVVDGSRKKKGKLFIDERDVSGSFATMEDGHTEPRDVSFTILDYDVKGVKMRPLTHFRKWKPVMIALLVEQGDVTIGPMVVSPYGPSERAEEVKATPPAPAK